MPKVSLEAALGPSAPAVTDQSGGAAPEGTTTMRSDEDAQSILDQIQSNTQNNLSETDRAQMLDDLKKGAKVDIQGLQGVNPTAATKVKKVSLQDAYGPDQAVDNSNYQEDQHGFFGNIMSKLNDFRDEHGGLPKDASGRRPSSSASDVAGFVQQDLLEPITNLPGQIASGIADNTVPVNKGRPLNDQEKQAADLLGFKNVTAFGDMSQESSQDYRDRKKQEALARGEAPAGDEDKTGFAANLDNPLHLILQTSAPSNFVQSQFNSKQTERAKYDAIQNVLGLQKIVANPTQYDPKDVASAQQTLDELQAVKDPTIKDNVGRMIDTVKKDPGKFGADLLNSLVADPELLASGAGTGAKVLESAKGALTGSEVAGKAVKVADKLIDTAGTGAGINTAISETQQMKEKGDANRSDLAMAGITGGAFGLALGSLGGVGELFPDLKGKMPNLEEAKLKGTYDDILKSQAQNDAAVENVVKGDSGLPPDVQTRIQDMLGIKSKADGEKFLQARRKDVRSAFKTQSDYADYLEFKANEMIDMRELNKQKAADAETKAGVEKQKAANVENAYQQFGQEKKAQAADDYDKALAQKDQTDVNDSHAQALADDKVYDAGKAMDRQDAYEAMMEQDVPAIRKSLLQTARRDARTGKTRGSADPEMLARLAVTGAGAATGYALSDKDHKIAGSILGGLTGLLIPGGGKVLDRMRQGGAVDPHGGILGLMLKEKKLPNESAVIDRAKTGDQRAYKELYNQYFPRLERSVRSLTRDSGKKLGIESHDIAQDAFVKAFANIKDFKGDSEFYTWLHRIAQNEGLNAISKASRRVDTTTMHTATPGEGGSDLGAGHIMDGDSGSVKSNVEAASATRDTPENIAIAKETQDQLNHAFSKLPGDIYQTVVLKELEGLTEAEIADTMNVPIGTVKSRLNRGRDMITESLSKGYGAKRPPTASRQAGSADRKLLSTVAIAGLGATAGAYLSEENHKFGALIGAGLALAGRAALRGGIVPALDKGLGLVSTRIKNMSEPMWRRSIEFERINLRNTAQRMKAVDPFLIHAQKLDPDTRGLLKASILTGKGEITSKLLDAIGDTQLKKEWQNVRGTLDDIGNQLADLGRFKKGEFEHFPRIVKDYDGLMQAVGKKSPEKMDFITETLKKEDTKSVEATGKPLSDLDRSKIVNGILQAGDDFKSYQPGYAKRRSIDTVTPEYAQYYEDMPAALHSYIRSATQDIEKAKFFGQDLKNVEKNGQTYINDDASIGNLVARQMKEGKLTGDQAEELGQMLKARFGPGEQGSHRLIQAAKDIGNAGLLGNPVSAINQFGDVIAQGYTQGILPTLNAIARQLTGNKRTSVHEFGLAQHVAEEFVSTRATSKFVQRMFKYGGFSGVDELGKNTSLNAALSKFEGWSKTASGIAKLKDKYGEALGDEFPKLVDDLKKVRDGEKPSDLVNSLLFAELSRSQPITRLELPEQYLRMPNGRTMYWLHTFQMKMLDIARRDSYNEIKKGNVMKGVKNLVHMGIIFGLAGASADAIQNFVLGKPLGFSLSGMLTNAFKTYGLSQYTLDKAFGVSKRQANLRRLQGNPNSQPQKAEFVSALFDTMVPPHRMFDEIVRADPKAVKYIPIVGQLIYAHMMGGNRSAEEVKKDRVRIGQQTRRANERAKRTGDY